MFWNKKYQYMFSLTDLREAIFRECILKTEGVQHVTNRPCFLGYNLSIFTYIKWQEFIFFEFHWNTMLGKWQLAFTTNDTVTTLGFLKSVSTEMTSQQGNRN